MKKIAYRIFIFTLFIGLLVAFIAYSRGYRFNLQNGSIVPTGILSVASNPKPGRIYVDRVFKGATDTNLTLPPGTYTVEVKKDGYTSYKKRITLKGEIVETIDALLFPVNPSLSPLTNLGIVKAFAVDQTNKVVLLIEGSTDAEKDGIYLFDAGRGPISFFPPLTTLLLKQKLPPALAYKDATIFFSPKFDQVILEFPTALSAVEGPLSGPTAKVSYLISLTDENQEPFDITSSQKTLVEAWMREKQQQYDKILETYPRAFQKVARESMRLIAFAPNETKVFYQATADVTIPLIINPPLIASNQTPETRTLKKGELYVYDRKEDKNFKVDYDKEKLQTFVDEEKQAQLEALIQFSLAAVLTPAVQPTQATGSSQPTPQSQRTDYLIFKNNAPVQWYPNSRNLVINEEFEAEATKAPARRFTISDYDGTNKQTVYSGPYEENFFVVTADGKLLIEANLNPQVNKLPDLYAVGIR